MPRLCQKFIASVLSATLIYGSDAACKTQAEMEALMGSLSQKVSEACRLTMNIDTSPPQCGENAKACGLLVSVETSLKCTGPKASCTMMESAVKASLPGPTMVPMPQECYSDVCMNDETSVTALKNFAREATQASLCQSSQANFDKQIESNLDTLKSMNVSLELVLTAAEPKLSCDKNSEGNIVIDGITIPSHQDLDKDEHDHTAMGSSSSSGTSSGSGSMTKCDDVKMAYKAAGCCGNPQKDFTMMNAGRRLSREDELLESVKAELRRAEAKGGATQARALAKSIDGILANFAA